MEIGIGLGITRFPGWGVMNIGQLFASGEQGAWYDPSDMSTLFQDSAGTVPVTAVEQPVGGMLDLSGRGNHATQATTTKRPVLSRRVNLLQKTEVFTFAGVWQVQGSGQETTDGFPGPGGKNNACRVVNTTGNVPYVAQSVGITYSVGVKYRATTYVAPYNGAVSATIYSNFTNSGGAFRTITVNLSTGTFSVSNSAELLDVSATKVAGFWRISYEGIAERTTGHAVYTSATASVVGTGLFVAEPSLTLAIDAHLPYQYVNTDTDYDADPNKFPAYLRFDGVDDAMQTGNIDFTGTDKMTMWAGVSRIANGGIPIELSTAVVSNAKSFYLFAGNRGSASGARWTISSRGSAVDNANQAVETAANYDAPLTNVVTGAFDISGDSTILRINGGQIGSATGDQGTGTYGNYPLYIGARAGTSLYFNGRLYSLIVRGAQSNLSQIEAAERYIKQKMRLP